MGDITTSKNFTAGETVTASDLNAIMSGSSIASGIIDNADINGSAAIALTKLDSTGDMDANSYQVGASTVIDSSSNLTNINNATIGGNSTIGGTLGVTGNASFTTFSATGVCAFSANVDFTGLGATTDLHAGITNLGASATQQINMNGTFAGTPTIAGATFASGSDKVVFLDADDSDNIKVGTITVSPAWSSSTKAISAAATVHTIAHGLGAAPSRLRLVLQKTSAGYDTQFGSGTDFPIQQNDEVELSCFRRTSGGWAAFNVKVDATNISITPAVTTPWLIVDGNNQAISDITTNYQLKAYFAA